MAEGCGQARRLTCPWHAWSYELSESLVGVAHTSTFGEIDKSANGLIALPAVERYGLLFVTPTPGMDVDIDDVLEDLGPELASHEFDKLHRVNERAIDVDVNWKLGNDTGFELYHVAYLHKDSVGPANIGNTGLYRRYGYSHRMVAVSPAARQLAEVPEDQWEPMDHLQFIYNVFPSTGIVVSAPLVALTRLDPGPVPGRSTFRFSSYSRLPLDDENVRAGAKYLDEFLYNVVASEDFVTAARTQATLTRASSIDCWSGAMNRRSRGHIDPAIPSWRSRGGTAIRSMFRRANRRSGISSADWSFEHTNEVASAIRPV